MAWIRSQDKTKLIDVNNIRFTHYGKEVSSGYNIVTFQNTLGWITLGVYSTEEKALEVMDMIQKYIGGKSKYYITKDLNGDYHVLDDMDIPMRYCKNGIFEIPTDMEI